MAFTTYSAAVAGAVSLFLYILVGKLYNLYLEKKWAKTHGTQMPFVFKTKLPFGIDWYFLLSDHVERDTLPEFFRSVFDKNDKHTARFSMLGIRTIQTREPRNVQAILATQFKEFQLGPNRYNSFAPLLGLGIFTSDGKFWEMSRALMRPQFSREQVSHLQSLEEHVNIMLQNIPVDGTSFDLQELFFRLTLDTATEFLLGESVNSLVRGDVGFGSAFNKGMEHVQLRIRLRSLYFLHNPKEFQEVNRICRQFVDRFVNKILIERKLKPSEEKVERKSSKYVFLEALAEESQDPILLRDQCMNILLAGRDTTAGLLSFVFTLLGKHPQEAQKLRDAIKADFGEEGSQPITFENLKNCTYLKWVINETLRLFPVVPFNGRVAIKDTTLPLGGGPDQTAPMFVRKGDIVEYSPYVMQRREDIWGPDASLFRPERWSDSRRMAHAGWSYLPFNGGPRVCIGQQFALTEASYTIVRLFQRFNRMESLDYTVEYKCKVILTMFVGGKNGVPYRMFKE